MLTRKLVLNIVFWLVAAGCALGIVRASAERPEFTIRVGFLGSMDDEDYDGAMALKTYVESEVGDRVEVQVFPSGQFCSNERECIEYMQFGLLDVFMTTIGGMGNVYGPGQVLDLPYIFRDDAIAECVFDGPIVGDLRQALLDRDLDIRLMVVSNTGGWRNFATTSTPIRSPDDVQGLKIRTTSAEIQQELVRQLGGNPTPVAWSETYTALATSTVEGTKNSPQDIINMKFHESLNYITLDGHAYMGALWWYSEPRWEELPEDIQGVVQTGFADLQEVTRSIPKERQADAEAEFRAAGGEIYALSVAEKQAFVEATSGMRAWYLRRYADEGGAQWLERVDAAIAACDPLSAGSAASP